jgi:PAS domain S-box-containing protein
MAFTDSAEELKHFQRGMSDLVSMLALPAVWSGQEPRQIVTTFHDALLATLNLEFVYTRARTEANGGLIEIFKTATAHTTSPNADKIHQTLNKWFGGDPQRWPTEMRSLLGGREVSLVSKRLGIEGEIGIVVAGSERADFPTQSERLLLDVAANQVTVGLRQARHLSEQKRIADELDRRVAERTRELAEANEVLQLQVGLLQHLPVSAWTLRPDGTPDFVNQVWLEFSGQTLDFVRSHPEAWMNAVHPEDRETASRAFGEGVRLGRGFAFETRSLRAQDGTYRWHLNQAVVLRDAEGKVLKFIGTTTDIDDQKRAQEELRASETNLREILNGIPGFVCTLNPAGQIDLANRPLLDFFGMTVEELNSWGTNGAIHPDDLPRVIAEFTHSMTTGIPIDTEARYRRADGVYRWSQLQIVPVRDTEGKITVWYGLLTDIEDRKRAEDELRRSEARHRIVVETASDAVVSIDEGGTIILANPATKRIFGHNPEELIGKPLTVLMPGAMRGLHETGFKRYLETGARHLNWQGTEVTALRANGEEFPAEVSFGEMTLDQRKIFTGFIRDISGKKRAEEELRNSQAELARMMRVMTIGQLTASIAHEVNQPLSGIVMNASTCLRMLSGDQPNIEGARETARRTIRDGNRASEIVTRLRTLFKRKEVAAESIDLNDAAREVIALSLSELQRDRILVRHDLAENLPAVKGDRIQLQQVILNLMRNALDAMRDVDDRPRELLIKTESDDSKNVKLTMQDTGIGFAPDAANRLFDSFYTTKDGGMGVGLSVSRSIIEAHRGRIWASANEGPGSSFAFSIPRDYSTEPA